MIFYLLVFVTLILGLVLQILFSTYVYLFGITIEFVLIAILYFSLRYKSLFGEVYGFLSGLLLDTFLLSPFGLHALLFSIFGFIAGRFSHKLDESKIKVQVGITLIFILFYYLFIYFTTVILSGNTRFDLFNGIIKIIFNSAITPVIFKLLNLWGDKIERWSGKTKPI